MSRCELSGKGPRVKNLVSHSNIKTKSRHQPNVQSKKLFSRTLNRLVTLKVATSTIKSLEAMGGLDVYVLNAPEAGLSHRARELKSRIKRRVSAAKVASKASTKTATRGGGKS